MTIIKSDDFPVSVQCVYGREAQPLNLAFAEVKRAQVCHGGDVRILTTNDDIYFAKATKDEAVEFFKALAQFQAGVSA